MIDKFHEAWLDTLPAPQGALEAVQRRGRELLKTLQPPNKSQESWRLTNIKKLTKLLSLPISGASKQSYQTNDGLQTQSPTPGLRLILDPTKDPLESVQIPLGLRILSQEELEQNLGNTLAICGSNGDWPVVLNQASATNILGLRVTSNELISLEIVIPAKKGVLTPTRVIIILEEKAKLDLLQVTLGDSESAHSHVIEVHLGQESILNHGFVAIGTSESNLLANLAIKQESRSSYCLTTVQKNWSLSRIEPRIIQMTGQASTKLRGLQIATGQEQLATHSLVRFDGPEGCLDQLHKSTADGQGHSIFNGAIEVPRIAQKTNAAQLSRNILLSKLARVDSKPELEIIADDVTCSHGATVSELEEDEIFYLRSRGIAPDQATELLVNGYYQEILSNLPKDAMKWAFINEILSNTNE